MVHEAAKFPRILAIVKKLELPMLVLSFVWLCVLVAELAYGEYPLLTALGGVLWLSFLAYFTLRLLAVQNREALLRKNWLFLLAIFVSMLRFFPPLNSLPLVRVLTATFGMQVIWIFASADQGLRSVRRYLGRRGAGYALALTFVVAFAGAAGMLHFENMADDPQGLDSFPKALWWTSMQMTNIGSAYAIKTTGGRILCLAISVYAAAMFGYLTALFATFFIDRDVKDSRPDADRQKTLEKIEAELLQLRGLMQDIGNRLPKNPGDRSEMPAETGARHEAS